LINGPHSLVSAPERCGDNGEVEATAYDFDNDGTVDYVEGEAHTEVYAQDADGNWAYGEADVEVAAS
jgi:hypothetical protein